MNGGSGTGGARGAIGGDATNTTSGVTPESFPYWQFPTRSHMTQTFSHQPPRTPTLFLMILLQSTLLGLQNVDAQRGSDNLNTLVAMNA
jgi:hypothetical protein